MSRSLYLYLAIIVPSSVLTVGLLIWSPHLGRHPWLQALTMNVATTLLGIPVTILLVDTIIQRHARQP